MKKIFVLTIASLLMLTACGGNDGGVFNNSNVNDPSNNDPLPGPGSGEGDNSSIEYSQVEKTDNARELAEVIGNAANSGQKSLKNLNTVNVGVYLRDFSGDFEINQKRVTHVGERDESVTNTPLADGSFDFGAYELYGHTGLLEARSLDDIRAYEAGAFTGEVSFNKPQVGQEALSFDLEENFYLPDLYMKDSKLYLNIPSFTSLINDIKTNIVNKLDQNSQAKFEEIMAKFPLINGQFVVNIADIFSMIQGASSSSFNFNDIDFSAIRTSIDKIEAPDVNDIPNEILNMIGNFKGNLYNINSNWLTGNTTLSIDIDSDTYKAFAPILSALIENKAKEAGAAPAMLKILATALKGISDLELHIQLEFNNEGITRFSFDISKLTLTNCVVMNTSLQDYGSTSRDEISTIINGNFAFDFSIELDYSIGTFNNRFNNTDLSTFVALDPTLVQGYVNNIQAMIKELMAKFMKQGGQGQMAPVAPSSYGY